jgi:proteasome lid subunit RPN8/RPN11
VSGSPTNGLEACSRVASADRVLLDRASLDRARRRAAGAAPEEVCGLLFRRHGAIGPHLRLVALRNRSPEPRRGFELDPGGWVAAEIRAGSAPVGVWHSHPERPARPSAADLGGAWPGAWHLLIPVCGGRSAPPRLFREDGGRALELPWVGV